MIKAIQISGLILLVFFAYCCEKIRSYPAEPHIKYISYSLSNATDTLQNKVRVLTVAFSFEDGDGDLFRDSTRNDSTSKIYYIIYKHVNGTKIKVSDTSLPSSFNFPWDPIMSRNGQDKLQKGTIKFNYFFNYPLPFDTINFEFFITDGLLNKSNHEIIPSDIIL